MVNTSPPAFGGDRGASWYLETHLDGGRLWRVPLRPLPFRVGRREGLHLMVPSDAVSSEHAEIRGGAEGLRLCDLGSTNGTFINRQRIEGECPLRDGDIVHFGDFEFRVAREAAAEVNSRRHTAVLGDQKLPETFLPGTRELSELIRERAAIPFFQPIVELPQGRVAALEALGRGRHTDLPSEPGELFRIAATIGLEVELSRVFRIATIESLRSRSGLPPIFLNTHPAELEHAELIDSLVDLHQAAPDLDLVVEVHERFLADTESMARLRDALKEIGVRLAYDDFGVGQARLLELAEVPPDFLKFDASFIKGVDAAPPSKRRLLTALVAAARDLGVITIAEGIETEAEHQACVEAGFAQGQGFFFGRPGPLEEIIGGP